MPAPRRIPPVRPSSASPETGTVSSAAKREVEPIGKLLIKVAAVTRQQVDEALVIQRRSFKPIGRILREEFGLSADVLAAALRRQDSAPRVFLRFFPLSNEIQHALDLEFCRQHEAVAFEKLGKMLCVAFSNPNTKNLLRHIELLTQCEVKAFSAPWEDIQKRLALG
ncbi:MAG TPA: hypothetical protein VKX17_24515 [Planctomycetota bacterium]|nr:hypothetical protein [Planctomycetota bacterium]